MPGGVDETSSFLLYSPDGKSLAVLDDNNGILRVWQPARPSGFLAARQKPAPNHPVAFSPDGKYLAFIGVPTGRGKPQLLLWDLAEGTKVQVLGNHPQFSGNLLFSRDGKRLASLVFDGVRWWDLPTRRELPSLKITRPFTMVFSPDGRLLAVDDINLA